MVILGLTGSIGMGKTTAAKAFRRLGVPVHDSDAVVHALTSLDGAAIPALAEAFPGVVVDGRLDRDALAGRVFNDEEALARLESLLHPLVIAATHRFLRLAARRKKTLVVLDVPLLYETGGEERCDAVAVVSAPYRVQRQRVLGRPGMTEERLQSILERQMPDAEKCRRADFIVPTGLGRAHSLRSIADIVRVSKTLTGTKWPPRGYRPKARKQPAHA